MLSTPSGAAERVSVLAVLHRNTWRVSGCNTWLEYLPPVWENNVTVSAMFIFGCTGVVPGMDGRISGINELRPKVLVRVIVIMSNSWYWSKIINELHGIARHYRDNRSTELNKIKADCSIYWLGSGWIQIMRESERHSHPLND